MILSVLLVIAFALYLWAILLILKHWRNRSEKVEKRENDKSVSVVVVYRNEEPYLKTLLESLRAQEYPSQKLEFIFVDDHSDDGSYQLVEEVRKTFPFDSHHLKLPDGSIGKKNGLQTAIQHAHHEWILTTDADCSVGSKWVASMTSIDNAIFVSGPVLFKEKRSWWSKLVELDFISLITIGGSLMRRGSPILANGANMLYKRAVFIDVNGYQHNETIASGDDIFLLEKFNRQPGNIVFNQDEKAIVQTQMAESVTRFFRQRIRWAKKTQYAIDTRTNDVVKALVGFYTMLVFAFVAVFFVNSMVLLWTLTFVFGCKLVLDHYFFKRVLPFYDKSHLLPYVFIVDFLHPFYMVIIAVLSVFARVKWKNRVYKNG